MGHAWLGWQGSNLRMRESKSRALPLGYTPTQVVRPPHQRQGKEEKNGVSSGIRTHGIQSHNLALYR